jgi:hypothetical protein
VRDYRHSRQSDDMIGALRDEPQPARIEDVIQIGEQRPAACSSGEIHPLAERDPGEALARRQAP